MQPNRITSVLLGILLLSVSGGAFGGVAAFRSQTQQRHSLGFPPQRHRRDRLKVRAPSRIQ